MSELLIPHPLNEQLKIDFSVTPPVYSLEIPYGREVVNKVICSIEHKDWHEAWNAAGAIIIEHMNTSNCRSLSDETQVRLKELLDRHFMFDFTKNNYSAKFEPLLLEGEFNGIYSSYPGFEPIRICRSGEADLYYEINGVGAFFYCTFKFNGRHINACLGHADCLDWETARIEARKFIMAYSLHTELLERVFYIDSRENEYVNFNLMQTVIFLDEAQNNSGRYAGFDELCFDVTGSY